ncbi:DUF2304 domain-containing protein [Candidatus Woesearchaeota archaeon]|nr:MAG: DUF2304 domain-containing protein [Candidatus Woesearchaeota archaeon]
MELFQILIIIFALFAFSRVMIQRKNKNFSFNEFIFWGGIWIVLIAVSFSKPILTYAAGILGFSRGVDILIYGGIIVLFYMLYRLYAKVDKQQQEITELVNRIAVDNPKKKK